MSCLVYSKDNKDKRDKRDNTYKNYAYKYSKHFTVNSFKIKKMQQNK